MHTGEVSGFLAVNRLYPAKGIAVTVLSNEDGVRLIGPLSEQIASIMLEPARSAQAAEEEVQIRKILTGLQQGRVDRSLFTPDANSYFDSTALADYQRSLAPLGRLEFLIRQGVEPRGGMTHLSFRVQYERKAVLLNVYRTPSGKYEQFLVEGQAE